MNNNHRQKGGSKAALLLALLVVGMSSGYAGDGSTHVEFKYYGFYSVIDYTYMFCLPNESGQYMDPVTGQIVGFVDRYSLNGITAIAGWQFRKETALGIGFSYLSDPVGSFSQIPVFVELRSHYLRNRVTPFTSVQMGYSIPFGSKNLVEEYTKIAEGGITFGFETGARFAISQKFGLNVFAGYQLIQLRSVERGFNSVACTQMPELYHNFKFGVGVNF